MGKYISKSLWLLVFSVGICCGIYPAVLWAIGQTIFPFQANGSILQGPDGKAVGSLLVAQPFTKDEYFQPRPSAASYDASASASSTLAASNYMLRNRVASALGPIVKYKSGPKAGQLVAPDIEAWFRQDRFGGQPHIVAQWADLHNAVAQAWVNADPTHAAYVDAWAKSHADVVSNWVKSNPGTPQPKAPDLAVVFFENFSKDKPGRFPSAVTETKNGKSVTSIEPVKEGSDIQSNFFDMWRQDHADADLQDVPGDMVTTSGSGLDPHITLENAEYQLDRIAAKWAADTKQDPAKVRQQIEEIIQEKAFAPLGGLAGERMLNVLEVNLELRKHFGAPA
ncbi:MAG TPA: potassium-transporting ATPase subunit C [Candidatus Binataceae bacterium]|jgi:K+-transporting ATPase ATPase C chain|nr:potassium-transporting ATPase subunit C [Candidatus Binataceae bacterium]